MISAARRAAPRSNADASVATVSDVVDRFLDAVGTRDFDAIASCFAEDARLRALVPERLRDEDGPEAIAGRYRFWLARMHSSELVEREHDELLDRERIRYRLRVDDPEDGPCVMEQEGYATVADGRITALNLVCSGFRPI